jgi:hypothetical protein
VKETEASFQSFNEEMTPAFGSMLIDPASADALFTKQSGPSFFEHDYEPVFLHSLNPFAYVLTVTACSRFLCVHDVLPSVLAMSFLSMASLISCDTSTFHEKEVAVKIAHNTLW